MLKAKIPFIKNFIEQLEESMKDDFHINNKDFSDLIIHIIATLKSDFPEIEDDILLNNSSHNRDGKILLTKLNMILADLEYERIEIEKGRNYNFWVSFLTWFESGDHVSNIFEKEYVYYDNRNGGSYYIDINYEQEFKLKYGKSKTFQDIKDDSSNDMIIDFIELAYEKWVNDRYNYTIAVNQKFEEFNLPFKLKKGKIQNKIINNKIEHKAILNREMFDNKLDYSLKMINSGQLYNKKSALDMIVDCLQFLISNQTSGSKKNQYKDIGIKIGSTKESKIYTVIVNELKEIMKISNEFFDIRHNEVKNNANELREPLTNLEFIEYLYNRCYALVNLIR